MLGTDPWVRIAVLLCAGLSSASPRNRRRQSPTEVAGSWSIANQPTPFGEELFDIPESQAETVVEPDG